MEQTTTGEPMSESPSMEKAIAGNPTMGKTIPDGAVHDGESMTENPTMEKTMPKLPTTEKAVTERPCRKVLR